eukprot:4158260-Lingulodinium_polyedra.AAC.1
MPGCPGHGSSVREVTEHCCCVWICRGLPPDACGESGAPLLKCIAMAGLSTTPSASSAMRH